jgi:sec-independent protein translocase protein TatC
MADPLTINPLPANPPPPDDHWVTPALGHLTELRNRLLWCVGVTLALVVATCSGAEFLTKSLLALAPKGVQFIQLTPGEAFMASIKVSVITAAFISLPVWLYHTACFVLPGLHPNEKKRLMVLVAAGLILFLLGAAFGLWVVGPQTTDWLINFGQNLAVNQLSIARYLDFVQMLVMLTGLAGELPLVLVGAVLLGVVKKQWVLAQWRQGIIAVFLAAALLTPGQDPFSMALVGMALLGLFLASLAVIRFLPE